MAQMTRTERLGAYIAAAARRRIDYVQGWDCAAGFVARWVEQERGVDGAALWRGCYHSAEQAQGIVRAAGGLEVLVGRGAAKAGLDMTSQPAPGDIGVVRISVAPDESAAAIRTAIGWAVLTERGVAVGNWPTAAAWRV